MTPRKKLSLIAILTLPLLALLWFTGHGQDSIFFFHLGMLLVSSSLARIKTFSVPGINRPVYPEWIPVALLLIDVPVALFVISANLTIQLPWFNVALCAVILPIMLFCFFFRGRLTIENRSA